MRVLKSVVAFGALALIMSFCLIGCSGENNMQSEKEEEFQDITKLVYELNHLAGATRDNGDGINYEGDSNDYRVYIDWRLEKYLDSICENYTKSNDYSDIVTSSQVRDAIENNFTDIIEAYKGENWKSNFLYKVFKWCGTLCKDYVDYDASYEMDRNEFDMDVQNFITNYDVVVGQAIAQETGETTAFKFKWQQR